jgi:hypothetical protein
VGEEYAQSDRGKSKKRESVREKREERKKETNES